MTDRLKGYIVVLDDNYREDDAECVTEAIRMIKGVLTVTPLVDDVGDRMARERVRYELRQRLLDLLR